MSESDLRSMRFSRRLMLRSAGLSAVAAAAILGAIGGVRRADAQTKVAQKVVAYRDTPKGDLQCDNCLHFVAPAACKTVDGVIAPTGWCKVYVKKPA